MRSPTITDLLVKQPSTQKYCVLAAPARPSFVPLRYPLLDERAQGRPGARWHPWALARKSRAESAKTTGDGGEHSGLPCAMVYSLFRALLGEPVPVCHRQLAQAFGASAKLGASVGAPGPHDFAVRKSRCSSVSAFTSTASRLTFVTIAIAPLQSRRDGECIRQIRIFEKRNIFVYWD